MQCNKKSAEKVAEKQLKPKQSKAEPTSQGFTQQRWMWNVEEDFLFFPPPPPLNITFWGFHPTPGCCHTRGAAAGRSEGGIWSLDVPNPNRAVWTGPGGVEKRGDTVRFQAIEVRPHSCDWDQNSSEQGYGIFNEYAYYQWGQGRGENQGRHITKMV